MARRPKSRADLGIDVVHLGIAPLDLHQHVVPGEVAGRRIVDSRRFELRLARAVLEGRVVDDEREVGIVERGLLHVRGVGQVAQRARLGCVALVDAEYLHAAAFATPRRTRRPLSSSSLKPLPERPGIGVAIPLPGVDPVHLDLALHLLEHGRFVRWSWWSCPSNDWAQDFPGRARAGTGEVVDLSSRCDISQLGSMPPERARPSMTLPCFVLLIFSARARRR